MALAVLDPQTGFPSASRALTATDLDGVPVILASALSGHTKGLAQDPRCSLLAGELGKGDPLAHPRITLQCLAELVDRPGPDHDRIRERFLDHHPKAALYVDFPDFRFFRLVPQSASLNGGFGRAYALGADDLVLAELPDPADWLDLQRTLRGMSDLASAVAEKLTTEKGGAWRFAGIDPAGFDLIASERQIRHEFQQPMSTSQAAYDYISSVLTVNARGIPSPKN
ncbi:putative heme iron utilization protein [Pseudorhizobium tarimense]|uniref:Heme iron utilization protein n=2 Tax=Pseudorhizobium tarimense TaxID=1079109 RepID=A0ABV2H6T2_9HYPH|nr:HugZ family protein [Pseudorhizobium tarimense]